MDDFHAGVMLGGHVRAVFTLVTFIFIACVIVTLYSFSEIPLNVLSDVSNIDAIKVSQRFKELQFQKSQKQIPPSPSNKLDRNGESWTVTNTANSKRISKLRKRTEPWETMASCRSPIKPISRALIIPDSKSLPSPNIPSAR